MQEDRFRSIQWIDNTLLLLDQRLIPHKEVYIECLNSKDVFEAIVTMAVRGAPAIGVAAAYGVALDSLIAVNQQLSFEEGVEKIIESIEYLRTSRPTAVNLFWALDKVRKSLDDALIDSDKNIKTISNKIIKCANYIFEDDIKTNLSIAKHGFSIVPDEATIIHHCNTGSLATVDYGTALGVIRYAHENGKKVFCYLDETRPRFQGASLSSYELKTFGIPHKVMVDSASGFLMKTKRVDLCIVGCDRVAGNGDTANKIGTYNLALAAHAHGVPFYVACPTSTIDFSIATGEQIEIEERSEDEILQFYGQKIAAYGISAWNPAFDVTPWGLITAFITEKGIIKPRELNKVKG
jgi:methylthioribose-1-phosphate isomerase